ncbi:E3 ubiquitin-protein ligase APD1-like [Prosopis cineraria]|uniref:E3 ubiquitin-protein ligase APD1-like n=1 Tax=Prosopis cineraria TaxID=364024 RepID=UPI00240F71A3|nr:E3 ubiquitin-protein ligase APD1-like [Prosopis cineraria]
MEILPEQRISSEYSSYHLSSKSSSIYLLIIEGTGMITQDIFLSSSYYVIARNLNEEAEDISNHGQIEHQTILTSDSQQNTSRDEWHVRLSFGPRWISYILGISGMTLLMYLSFTLIEKFQQALTDRAGVHLGETATQRAPLLSHKDDDLSSWGSSYDSMSRDEEDLDFLTAGSIDGKSLVEGETSNNTRRLCAICFDAPRDCFFLPCGHCVACFECGTRIAEADGTCPVCRRKTKKVRKIFNV